MGNLKMAIANAIFSQPETKPFNFRSIDGNDFGQIQNISFERVGNLEMLIKVKTKSAGTSYFRLKLSEQW